MKIPESIRIGGVDYRIECTSNLNDGEQMLYGRISFGDSCININSNSQGHQHKSISLWHEILHGIAEHANLDIENEERVVDVLAKGVYQVLQDNWRKLFDLEEGDVVD